MTARMMPSPAVLGPARPAPQAAARPAADESDALVELFLVPGAAEPAGVPSPAAVEPARPIEPARASGPLAARPRSLAACVRGLTPLEVRCPYAGEVELAVDGEGRYHVLGWRGPDASIVEQVLIAARWAREHAAVLAAVNPGPSRADAVAHLLTDEAARLRWLEGAGIELHLVVRIGAGWASASL